MREYVPVDEGEAEAQPDLPAVTVRLLDSAAPDEFPRQVRFEIPASAGKRAALEEQVSGHAERWIEEGGFAYEGEPKPEWLDTEDGRCRAVTYTLTGWRE